MEGQRCKTGGLYFLMQHTKTHVNAPPPPLSPFLFLSSYLSQVHDRRLFEFKRWLHKLYTVSRATTADALAVGRVGKPGH